MQLVAIVTRTKLVLVHYRRPHDWQAHLLTEVFCLARALTGIAAIDVYGLSD